jgi:hypothetical protein
MFHHLAFTLSSISLSSLTIPLSILGLSASLLSAQQNSTTTEGTAIVFATEQIKVDGSNLFEVLSQTFDRVALTGERNWFSVIPKDGSSKNSGMRLLRYRESIAIRPKPGSSSKEGFYRPADFSLTLLDSGEIGAQMSETEKSLRRAAFRDRSGFLHYQRDFRIQDAAQASKNYRVVPMGAWLSQRATTGPRVVRIFDLLPRGEHAKSSGASIFRVVVDMKHQIVLDWIRFSAKGQLISALSYDKFTIGESAEFKNTKWWKPWIDVKQHENTADASQVLGFAIAEPTQLPSGFRLLEVRSSTEPVLRTRYSVLIYTDGLRNMFLLQHRSSSLGAIGANNPSAGNNLVTVKRFRMGPVTQFDAEYKGMNYLLLGHEEAGDGVPELLKSLVR